MCCKAPPGYGTTPFLSQSASHRTSGDQMQSIYCPGQRTHHPVSHRASARDLTDYQIRSSDQHQETMEQLSLITQEIWDDIPQARITRLIPFMPCLSPFMQQRCRVVHEAHGLSQPLLILLHLKVYCTEQNARMKFCLANDNSWQIADFTHTKWFLWAVFTIIQFPVEIKCTYLFCSV